MKKLTVLCCALFVQGALAQSVEMSTIPVDFGIVNGEVVNNEIKIERTLNNPILISVHQQDYDKPLTGLVVKNATLAQQTETELVLTQRSSLTEGGMVTKVTLGLWVDGQGVAISGKQVGSEIYITVPTQFRDLELRVVKPVTMMLPRSYRGEFKYNVEVDAVTGTLP
ncbi:DUF5462 family protein [Photobacterium damselae]|uniref:DUF5462 family protein n=1 Tax=Photobacterium damselae TaxID=38293 RepID=UPI0040696961